MYPFEAGFIKFAEDECGLTPDEAAHAYKRAMEYQPAEELFKQLAPNQVQDAPLQDIQPEDYEALQQLMQQDQVQRQMQTLKQHLGTV